MKKNLSELKIYEVELRRNIHTEYSLVAAHTIDEARRIARQLYAADADTKALVVTRSKSNSESTKPCSSGVLYEGIFYTG